MNVLEYPQGSPEWHAYRAAARNATDAPAVLGCSPYVTRSELLRVRHTGVRPEVDAVTQRRFDDGHAIEEAQRGNAELVIGEELFPVVGSEEVDGLELSASFDGLNMAEDTGLEVKTINDDLRAVLSALGGIEENDGRALPKHYRVQMEQQCMVSGCDRILFVAADRTGDDVRRCWYYPDMELRAEILAAWRQFDKDLAAYEPEVVEVKPEGRTPETLPALRIEVRGEVTASNLRAFRDHAIDVFGGINRDLQTDQDFADAEKIVKWCSDVEARLDAAKQHVQSQMETVDEVFRTVDDIKGIARSTRLELAKLVDQRKVEIKEGLIRAGRTAYADHIQALKEETGGVWVDLGMPDFAGAAKGKRSVASIRDAVDTLLANAKIDADASAKRLRSNVAYLDEATKGFEFLFSDRHGLATKQLDDIKMVVSNRIEKHKLDKQREEEETRARIRREEQAKAEREAAEKAAAEKAAQQAAEREERQGAERAAAQRAADEEADRRAKAAAQAPEPTSTPAPAARPAPVTRQAPARRPAPPTRPTDAEIIAALVSHFEATEEQVIGWLCELDFSAHQHAA
ncbi:putative phage-related endonuclease [Cupriavidus metallidurans]|uniref:YqaJ viral recombinase family protein n=1 Tax=Cupriavidus metallidurans TaxID=119219 RepID=UPI00068ECBC1|nr:YqaJ viral recombinase family protein [Cupriavidus metallidurans]MDE4918591.1 YqaJ viral recombinase family protein [Cupriavidus metallidurans]